MILVTGGTGLVGSHLLFVLSKQGEKIVAIHRKNSDLDAVKNVFSYYSSDFKQLFSSITWVEADINDIPALTNAFIGISKVYHSAAMISFSSKDYRKMRKINIEGTANIVNLCIENNVEKLCFVSSVAAVGKPLSGKDLLAGMASINEENEWNVADNNYGYAITKHGAELEVWRAGQEGVDVVIVNPGVILGSGFWQSGSGKLFDKTYKGFPFYTEGITGFVDVRDVATIMIQLMDSSIKNERYILVSENESFKNVFFAIADALGKKRPSIKVTKLLSGIGWRINWVLSKFSGRTAIITKQSSKSAHNTYNYSNKKISEALDYEFIPLDDTIKTVCKNYIKDKGV
ncbi:NAD-dependent epimerase/dehydratase family protein [Aureibaculum sp. 2210JD6-5]|uniref:NAD-dependent epimerase/dehydratase family protein n=1 Tax=Aureibaculum sp. 2210JD6-5 TaxID=3103957 RepID=UPI002AAE3790|nr:NAD-dependent epimerase/dehydratase family protein [Aureibaculum sp. 2210JD6-5]MDY7394660.1 NAD-dependent epimerase/dehydratase family protein [Aureibaculum sp. 2210JD6-5]